MKNRFLDRSEAGKSLAENLSAYVDRESYLPKNARTLTKIAKHFAYARC
jgi:hypothetical protein